MLCIKVHCIIIPFNLHDNPMRWAFFPHFHFTDKEAQAPRTCLIHPRPCSNQKSVLASSGFPAWYHLIPTLGMKGLLLQLLSVPLAGSLTPQVLSENYLLLNEASSLDATPPLEGQLVSTNWCCRV